MGALYFLIIKNMKRFLVIILANLCALVNLMAQDDYVPTTTWPYIYPEFMNGEIMIGNGSTTKGLFNVCLADSQLHYIDGDLVKKATILDLQGVTIGKDTYVYADFNLYKVLSKSGSAVVAEGYSIDMAKLNGSEGAYGSSGSTLATQSLSSLEGIGGNRTNMNHMDLRNSKDSGKYARTSLSMLRTRASSPRPRNSSKRIKSSGTSKCPSRRLPTSSPADNI